MAADISRGGAILYRPCRDFEFTRSTSMEPEFSDFGEADNVHEILAVNDIANPFHPLRAVSLFLSVQGIPRKFPVL